MSTEDTLPENIRQVVENARIGYLPSDNIKILIYFFDQNYPKPKPLTWWETLALNLEKEARFVSGSKAAGLQLAANMLREEGKKNV